MKPNKTKTKRIEPILAKEFPHPRIFCAADLAPFIREKGWSTSTIYGQLAVLHEEDKLELVKREARRLSLRPTLFYRITSKCNEVTYNYTNNKEDSNSSWNNSVGMILQRFTINLGQRRIK